MSLKTARWFAAWRSPCAHASPHRARTPARQAGEVAMTDKTRPGEHNPIARRNFLLGAGTAVAASAAPSGAAQAQQPAAASSAAPAPEPDYQFSLTRREFFAVGITAANAWTRQTNGRYFDLLPAAERVQALTAME